MVRSPQDSRGNTCPSVGWIGLTDLEPWTGAASRALDSQILRLARARICVIFNHLAEFSLPDREVLAFWTSRDAREIMRLTEGDPKPPSRPEAP